MYSHETEFPKQEKEEKLCLIGSGRQPLTSNTKGTWRSRKAQSKELLSLKMCKFLVCWKV